MNKIQITERRVPSDDDIADRIGERLAVKVEQELRALPERDRGPLIDRFTAIVGRLASSEDGRRDLAAICAFYLQEHRPETTVREPEFEERPPRPRRSEGGGGRGRSRRGGGGGGGGRGRKRRSEEPPLTS
jgi:hypothetical protein